MPGKVKEMTVSDLSGFSDTSIVNETKEDYFREVADVTVKPVIARLRTVYDKYNRRYPWNAIIAIGMKVYSFARKGYDVDYYALARGMSRKWQLPANVTRDIVDAVLAEVRRAGGRR